MKNLDWFQARSIARGGRAVRRELWRKWLTFEQYVWLITQPLWETQFADRRVVQQSDFGAEEFMAHDWTDEPWPDGPQPPDPPDPPNPPDPPRPPQPPLPPEPPGNGGNEADASDPVDPTNPLISDPMGGGSDGGGPGGWGGWGSGGGVNGGPDGPKPPVPPKPPRPHQPPNPNVPTITVELSADIDTDGPSCFIVPPATCTIYVTVSIAGGPAGVGTLSVSGPGTPSPQLGTGWPGMNQSFTFRDVPVNPGGTITFFADYGAPGVVPFIHYIGSGSFTFPANCILFVATWSGDTTETKRCLHGPHGYTGIKEDGYDFTASYSTTGQFAVNPTAGDGKSAMNTGADLNAGNNAHGIYTPYPTGAPVHIDWWVAAPRRCTVDVDAQGAVSHTTPLKLGIFGADEDSDAPPCTFQRTSHESVSPA